MPDDDSLTNGKSEESRSLLSQASIDNEDDDLGLTTDLSSPPPPLPPSLPNPQPFPRGGLKRVPAVSQPSSDGPGAPRTPNRVRFDLASEDDGSEIAHTNGDVVGNAAWLDEDDYLNGDRRASTGQRAPLLTDITPPSSSPFLSESFQPEDHLPNARPTSGMRSAFMNMANSIIGAGIIGQPYAFKQAGMTMGILLLVGLTITVDWTIRLIIINSKLSGADSFQATMQHCFGKSGLIAISIAQWAFAFGGMVAFCVIIGDTIPHVLEAMIPGLREMSFLWLLTDRRAVIVLFVLGVSWPLSLYRDIAKVRASTSVGNASGNFTDKSPTAGKGIYIGVNQYVSYHYHCHHTRAYGPERSQRKPKRRTLCQQRLLPGSRGYFIWYDILWLLYKASLAF
jgi:solute carrier family 38 (sodium-coupled neutral amino acid transporter), member 11